MPFGTVEAIGHTPLNLKILGNELNADTMEDRVAHFVGGACRELVAWHGETGRLPGCRVSVSDADSRDRVSSGLDEQKISAIVDQVLDRNALFVTVQFDGERSSKGPFAGHLLLAPGNCRPSRRRGGRDKPGVPGVHLSLTRPDASSRAVHIDDDVALIEASAQAFATHLSVRVGLASFSETIPELSTLIRFGDVKHYETRPHCVWGYDWIQLLPPDVQVLLTAAGRDLDAVPAEYVKVIDGPSGPVMFVASRRSPYDVTQADMSRMRAWLLPVLYFHGPPQEGSAAAIRNMRLETIADEDWYAD